MASNREEDHQFTPTNGSRPPDVGVHVLSEHVFCPRAGLLALESGEDGGTEEPNLGPRLDGFIDYNAIRFVEELQSAWEAMRLWLTLQAPAALVVLITWLWISPFAAIVVSLPVFYLAGRMWDTPMKSAWERLWLRSM
jgi:hypothetical protein